MSQNLPSGGHSVDSKSIADTTSIILASAVDRACGKLPAMPNAEILRNPFDLIKAEAAVLGRRIENEEKSDLVEILIESYCNIIDIISSPEFEAFLVKSGSETVLEDVRAEILNQVQMGFDSIALTLKIQDQFVEATAEIGVVISRAAVRPSERSKFTRRDENLPTFGDKRELSNVVSSAMQPPQGTVQPRHTLPIKSDIHSPIAFKAYVEAVTEPKQKTLPPTAPVLSLSITADEVANLPIRSTLPPPPPKEAIELHILDEERLMNAATSQFYNEFVIDFDAFFAEKINQSGITFKKAIIDIARITHRRMMDRASQTQEGTAYSKYHEFRTANMPTEQFLFTLAKRCLRIVCLHYMPISTKSRLSRFNEVLKKYTDNPANVAKILKLTDQDELDAHIAGTTNVLIDEIRAFLKNGKNLDNNVIWLAYYFLDDEEKPDERDELWRTIYDTIAENIRETKQKYLERYKHLREKKKAEALAKPITPTQIVKVGNEIAAAVSSSSMSSVSMTGPDDAPEIEAGETTEFLDLDYDADLPAEDAPEVEIEGEADFWPSDFEDESPTGIHQRSLIPPKPVVKPADEKSIHIDDPQARVIPADQGKIRNMPPVRPAAGLTPAEQLALEELEKSAVPPSLNVFLDGELDARSTSLMPPIQKVESQRTTLPPSREESNKPGFWSKLGSKVKEGLRWENLKKNNAVRTAVKAVAAGAAVMATATFTPGDVVSKNYCDSDPSNIAVASAAKATHSASALGAKISEQAKEAKQLAADEKQAEKQTTADVKTDQKESTSKYKVNENALKGTKLLSDLLHNGGFKRAPGWEGDFTQLNFRLSDNATPDQMAAMNKVYQKYAVGNYQTQKNINWSSTSEAREFYAEAKAGFDAVGIGSKGNINWRGGDEGSFVSIKGADGQYIPFVREMLIARGVLVENAGVTGMNEYTPVNDSAPQTIPTTIDSATGMIDDAPTIEVGYSTMDIDSLGLNEDIDNANVTEKNEEDDWGEPIMTNEEKLREIKLAKEQTALGFEYLKASKQTTLDKRDEFCESGWDCPETEEQSKHYAALSKEQATKGLAFQEQYLVDKGWDV